MRGADRRTGMRLLSIVAVLAAVGVISIGRGGGADAVDGLARGYWWAAQPTSGGVPAPPSVPKDGLWVSSNASGVQAVSALRFSIGAGESSPILTLDVHGSTPVATGSVFACPTTANWAPGDAQAFATRPAADCQTVSVSGVASDDGKRMAFDLSLFPPSTTYNVVLFPVPTPLPVAVAPPVALPVPPITAPPPTLDVTFEPPQLAAVTVLTGPIPATATPPATSPASGSGDVSSGVSAGTQGAIATTPRPAARPTTTTPRRRATASVPLQRVSAEEDRTDRVLAALVFVALAGWAWRLSFSGGLPLAPARASIYGPSPSPSDAGAGPPSAGADRSGPPSLR